MTDHGGFDLLHPAIQHHVVNSLGWSSLRPLQRDAIAPIMAGRHVLALAPTASGKTEAAMLPLLHRMTTEGWRGLSVLYLCPLKALLNNLEPRLSQLCDFVGRRAALWHGDVGDTVRRAIRDDPPDVLLTTPESLEAMLISRHVDHDALLGRVRAVVVDEIHAFAGDDRGWHLVAVLERLARLNGGDVQRIGLSATVGDPERLLGWLVGSSDAPRRVVNPPTAPGDVVDPDVTVDHVGSVDNAAKVIASLHAGEKRLVFAESRSRVEDLAASLRALDVQTFVSHSSLSAEERRQAEQAFTEARNCVIVATSTLELGIDVGDLDRVIQLDAPQTVASFLQRLGRTGRRPGTTRNALFLTLRPEDRLLQTLGLLLRWRDGFVESIEPPALPYHLCAQQILAVVLQERAVGRSQLPAFAGRLPVFASFVADGSFEHIVQHLIDEGFLFNDDGVLSIGLQAEESFGYRHFIELTSSFISEPLLAVRWGNQDLGTIDPLSLVQRPGHPPTPLSLGGRSWEVVGIDWRRRSVTVTPADSPGRSRWQGSSRPLTADICDGMRRVLAGELPRDVTLSKRAEHALAELRADAPWARSQGTFLVDDGHRRRWWTFAGLRANVQLAADLGSIRADGRVDNLSIPVSATNAMELPTALRLSDRRPGPGMHSLARAVAEDLKFTDCLPDDLALAQANARLHDRSADLVREEAIQAVYP